MQSYGLSPLIPSNIGYPLTPAVSEKQDYPLTPVYVEPTWEFIRRVYLNSEDWGRIRHGGFSTPGNYSGYSDSLELVGYEAVKLVAVDGAWNDGSVPPDWRPFINYATQVAADILGDFNAFNTRNEALAVYVGKEKIFNLGTDKMLYLGIDDCAGLNSGIMAVDVYAK